MTDTTAERFGVTDTVRASGLAGLARKSTTAPGAGALTLDSIPDPDTPGSDTGQLTEAERRDLETCQRAVHGHHSNFWLTGKALDAVAKRRLYRGEFNTFEDLLEGWGISLADSSRMRRGWRLAARLLPDVPKLTVSHVEGLLPVVKLYDVEAAATLHALLRETYPKVTARVINEIVRELPGPDGTESPAVVIREQAEKVLTGPADPASSAEPTTANDTHLRQAVDQRARQLADDLKRSRIPRRELNQLFAEAFADTDDPQVYRALLRWMKTRNR
ncbi:hypothetical protein OHB41_51600 [Streptomyces sp. NBC_01571]|uniref:hypothetical protein n=1 Tax=Streptomyces sp. NBC_01571 TaxID=2975883 RepID=UPI0022580BA0|nr:hypothetical protein [Streptomyces sp. NBC_01571]MCX4581406.1 hypothetical protein [Streptomyces sp. NBC_01571]